MAELGPDSVANEPSRLERLLAEPVPEADNDGVPLEPIEERLKRARQHAQEPAEAQLFSGGVVASDPDVFDAPPELSPWLQRLYPKPSPRERTLAEEMNAIRGLHEFVQPRRINWWSLVAGVAIFLTIAAGAFMYLHGRIF